jgi:hypothetical protein
MSYDLGLPAKPIIVGAQAGIEQSKTGEKDLKCVKISFFVCTLFVLCDTVIRHLKVFL